MIPVNVTMPKVFRIFKCILKTLGIVKLTDITIYKIIYSNTDVDPAINYVL